MAKIMLDEYKTSDLFWVKVVNMAYHVTNRLYLHKILKKTSYDLLTGNKSSVSYFWVFENKCYVLQKMSKSSEFATKVYEGFLLGYVRPQDPSDQLQGRFSSDTTPPA
jgi:hypothetical protein